MTDTADAAKELEEKTKVIAHLTRTLAHTRESLEIARAALESIANEGASGDRQKTREIALNALQQI